MKGSYIDEADEMLFLLLKNNDDRAFSILYKRYWEKLLEVAFFKLQSQEEAEESVQQVFVDIWKNRHQTVLKYTFRTYISAALKYVIYAKLAQRKKMVGFPLDTYQPEFFVDNSTQEWLNFVDIRDNLETIVDQLPGKCQLVFRMSRETDLSNSEIATELDISVKSVEAHITKAIKLIKVGLNHLSILLFF
jgi:RNA polymerase sigma-70 factor (ECF subfamily)